MIKMKNILLIVLAFFITVQCQKNEKNGKVEETAISSIPVKVVKIMPEDVDIIVSGTGIVKPFSETMVSSEVNGKVKKVLVEVGDFVKAGQTLVEIDDELFRLSVEQANAQLMNTTANYNKAKKDRERFEKLRKDNSVTEHDLENAILQEKIARAGYLNALAVKKSAERQLKNTKIKSPINGKIAEKKIDIGYIVSPGTPVVKVIDISKVKVVLGVSEKEVVKIIKGQPVTLTSDAYPVVQYSGKVFSVSPQANLDTRTFPVEIVAPNNKINELKPGMVVRIKIKTGKLKNVIMITRDAIIEKEGDKIVFVVDKGIAKLRKLETGLTIGNRVQVKKGLTEGDYLVIVGQYNLIDGIKVKVNNF
ncbi:hypothetical protein DRQ09_04870 [candidate division KSB1 bacterium]|nr:MAG: hypothetical protein DRQ09_04870 [candidate division KSB1 bacterium]